ncbi:MAG: hypothetical protein IPF72_14930 [Chitinophagaceae bacterium]|nr:hypothetical protein [Chitinophagaceae bacterium]
MGSFTNVSAGNLTNATAIGARAFVAQNNSMVLGSINGKYRATADTRVAIGTSVPQKQLHGFYRSMSGAALNAATQILMEDNTSSYLEMSTPNAFENGILSSNTAGIRSGIIFGATNNLQLRTGGNLTRLTIDNGGYFGVNRTPVVAFNTGTFQVQSPNGGDDIFGIYNTAGTNRWTYYTAGTNLKCITMAP